jgi:CheY-like chemotaxis protein
VSKRILVVEDQPDNRQIIRDMLAPTDYEITEAENGEEALAAIAKQRAGENSAAHAHVDRNQLLHRI